MSSTDPAGVTTTRTERFRLATNLLDWQAISAAQLADCYHQRWEIETSYQNLKTRQRGPRIVLRSRDAAGVRQETWAYLITYQAIRQLISHTAAEHHLDTDRLSFLTCLRATRRHLINRAVHTTNDLHTALRHLADELLDDQLDPRRSRSSPRAVKRPNSPYRSKKPTEPATTSATYKITIIKREQQDP